MDPSWRSSPQCDPLQSWASPSSPASPGRQHSGPQSGRKPRNTRTDVAIQHVSHGLAGPPHDSQRTDPSPSTAGARSQRRPTTLHQALLAPARATPPSDSLRPCLRAARTRSASEHTTRAVTTSSAGRSRPSRAARAFRVSQLRAARIQRGRATQVHVDALAQLVASRQCKGGCGSGA